VPSIVPLIRRRRTQFAFRGVLALADFDVREAADGYSALRAIEQWRPSAIMLDLGLPGISGQVVLQELASQALTRNIPVIVVTGQLAESMEGAACLRRKPVSPDRLVNTVRACITAGGAAEPG